MSSAFQRYIVVRLLLALSVLGWALGYVIAGGGGWSDWRPFVDVSGVALLLQVAAAAWVRRRAPSAPFIALQLALDIAISTAFVHFAGVRGTLFVYLYLPIIAGGAWLLGMRGALGSALLASVALLGVTAAHDDFATPVDEGTLLLYFETMFRIFAFFLLAVLTGYLGESLARTGRALTEERRSSRVLATEHGTVLDRVRAGVVTTDAAGHVVAQNPFARALLGDVTGRSVTELFRIPEASDAWEEARPDGQRWVCTVAPLPEGGRVVLVDDVTELARMRERAARDERLVAAGQLSASLAHEVRNPLAGLSGSLQLLREDRPSRLLDLALRETERLNRLVEDYLAASRRTELARQRVDVHALAADVVEAFGRDPRFTGSVVATVEGQPTHATADPDRLRQALWNLVLNGAQAMPRGGEVKVSVTPEEEGWLTVRVEDEGVGIPEADRERIFDPFHSARTGGTGLGLAVVEQVVRAHGGTIRVESRPGGGTSFVMWLPLEPSLGA